MTYIAKIILTIQDNNGSDTGIATANDANRLRVLRRTGPEEQGGAWEQVYDTTSLQPGKETLVFEDTDIQVKVPYYYKTEITRGTVIKENPTVIGPIVVQGLHQLSYPGAIAPFSSSVPNFISEKPLVHYDAESTWLEFGSPTRMELNRSHYVKNQVAGVTGYDFTSPYCPVGVGVDGVTPYIGLSYLSTLRSSVLFRDIAGAYSSVYPTSDGPQHRNLTMDKGFTWLLVYPRVIPDLYDGSGISQGAYSYHYDAGGGWSYMRMGYFSHTLPSEWIYGTDSAPSAAKNHLTNNTYYHPVDYSTGEMTEINNFTYDGTEYYGPPNGVHWEESGEKMMPAYYGHGGRMTTNTQTWGSFGGGGSYVGSYQHYQGRSDYNGFWTNSPNVTTPQASVAFGDEWTKLGVEVGRCHPFGSTHQWRNGTLLRTMLPNQSTRVENLGHNDNEIRDSWWGLNGHAHDYSNHASADVGESTLGLTYHVPPQINAAWQPMNTYSNQPFTELLIIPDALTDQDFTRLTTYILNRYGDRLVTQGDYST